MNTTIMVKDIDELLRNLTSARFQNNKILNSIPVNTDDYKFFLGIHRDLKEVEARLKKEFKRQLRKDTSVLQLKGQLKKQQNERSAKTE